MLLANQILDTLKFKESEIYLKNFHQARTFEACRYLSPKIQFSEIENIYSEIEKKYSGLVSDDQILRLTFEFKEKFDCFVEVAEKVKLPIIVNLQINNEDFQSQGLGPQNYKWARREFWDYVLQKKNPIADDVICINQNFQLTETSRCNLFLLDQKKDLVLTPLLSSGCINGVYRRYVMSQGFIELPDIGKKKVQEADLAVQKISQYEIYVANSVREVLKAKLLV